MNTDSTTEATPNPFILAHEFFDALPIHVFQNVASSSIPPSSTILTPTGPIKPREGSTHAPQNQWHELVVTPAPPSSSPLSPTPTGEPKKPEEKPEFQLTVSKTPTPHSLYLPQLSERYKALAKTPGAVIEISPESLAYVTDFAVRIGGGESTQTPASPAASSAPKTPSGCALILDYGPSTTIPANTLRGIRSHTLVSPFLAPGTVDLSADVDFLALAETAINSSPGVEVHGPVEQGWWLHGLGVSERVGRLLKRAEGEIEACRKEGKGEEVQRMEEEVRRLESGYKRLVDRGPTGMGRIYKVLALVPFDEMAAVRRPVGFGGDVVG